MECGCGRVGGRWNWERIGREGVAVRHIALAERSRIQIPCKSPFRLRSGDGYVKGDGKIKR